MLFERGIKEILFERGILESRRSSSNEEGRAGRMRTSASVLTCWIWTCSESMMLFALALDAWSAASRSSSLALS